MLHSEAAGLSGRVVHAAVGGGLQRSRADDGGSAAVTLCAEPADCLLAPSVHVPVFCVCRVWASPPVLQHCVCVCVHMLTLNPKLLPQVRLAPPMAVCSVSEALCIKLHGNI